MCLQRNGREQREDKHDDDSQTLSVIAFCETPGSRWAAINGIAYAVCPNGLAMNRIARYSMKRAPDSYTGRRDPERPHRLERRDSSRGQRALYGCGRLPASRTSWRSPGPIASNRECSGKPKRETAHQKMRSPQQRRGGIQQLHSGVLSGEMTSAEKACLAAPAQGERRFLPFALRARSTSRPLLVADLCRKP
jgi:hypothetical protein